MSDLSELSSRITASVLTPGDEGFVEEVTGFNLAMVHRPDVVVAAEQAGDVVEAVRYAREQGMPVHVQATGHGSLAPIEGGLLISLRRMSGVTIDPTARTATFLGGTRWSTIVAAAAAFGLAPITGSAASVGAVGFLLGGGLGPLNRSHGFGSDYLRSASVVTGTGELVTASADEHADLFWALRGGKAGLGVVVEATVGLVELSTLYAGSLFFDIEHGAAVLGGWLDWTRTAPADVSTSLAIIRMPDLDVVPPPLRGRHLLSLRFAYPGATADGATLAAPLRALAPVHLDALGELPASQMALIHSDPTDPAHSWVRGFGVTEPDRGFAAAFLGTFGAGTSAPFVAAELRHLDSATRTDVPEGSAVGARRTEYVATLVGIPDPALRDAVLPAAFAGARGMLAPWLAETTPINWIEEPWLPEQFASAWDTGIRVRLAQVRAAYDPDGLFPYGPPA
jgi:FAD/FMN-containing dehydrogenase